MVGIEMEIFAFTLFLNCSQLNSILNRLDRVTNLTELQKRNIVLEISRVVPTCSFKFQNYEYPAKQKAQSFGPNDIGPSDDSFGNSGRSQKEFL